VQGTKIASPCVRSSSRPMISSFSDDSVTQIVDVRIIAPSINTRFYPSRQKCPLARRLVPGSNLHGIWLKGIGRRVPGRSHCTDGIHSIFGKAIVLFNPRCKKKATVATKIFELQPIIPQRVAILSVTVPCRHLRRCTPLGGVLFWLGIPLFSPRNPFHNGIL
jgi:hypothetical protein